MKALLLLLVGIISLTACETSIETFMSQYPRARVSAQYRTENDIIEAFYNNKSKTIVITRDFNDKEKEYLKSKNVSYRSDKIASDAVVIIMHPTMSDTILSVEQIRNLLGGNKTKLPSNTLPKQIVFDQNGSANFNFMVNMLQITKLGRKVSALHSNQEVIQTLALSQHRSDPLWLATQTTSPQLPIGSPVLWRLT